MYVGKKTFTIIVYVLCICWLLLVKLLAKDDSQSVIHNYYDNLLQNYSLQYILHINTDISLLSRLQSKDLDDEFFVYKDYDLSVDYEVLIYNQFLEEHTNILMKFVRKDGYMLASYDLNINSISCNYYLKNTSILAKQHSNHTCQDISLVFHDYGLKELDFLLINYLQWTHQYYDFEVLKESNDYYFIVGKLTANVVNQDQLLAHKIYVRFDKKYNIPIKLTLVDSNNNEYAVWTSLGEQKIGNSYYNDRILLVVNNREFYIKLDAVSIGVELADKNIFNLTNKDRQLLK